MSIPIKVCKIPNKVMLGIFFLQFWRDFFIFQVIPKQILHLRVSLIIFNLIINQQNPNKSKKIYVRTNFNLKMSKLLGQVGRVDNKSTCPILFLSILRYQVGRVHPIWTYVQNLKFFFKSVPKVQGTQGEPNLDMSKISQIFFRSLVEFSTTFFLF